MSTVHYKITPKKNDSALASKPTKEDKIVDEYISQYGKTHCEMLDLLNQKYSQSQNRSRTSIENHSTLSDSQNS